MKLLERVGLSSVDAEVYIFLAKVGPQRIKDLTESLNRTKQQLYPALKSLQKKGIVNVCSKRSTIFSAIAFEELLNQHVELTIDRAQTIKETKQELLSSWRDLVGKSNG